MFSIICVFNNKEIMEENLLKGLNKQNADFELITIDNTKNDFHSAPKALNFGGRKAKGEYLIFVHQDVIFLDQNWLRNAEKILQDLPKLGIAGCAGVSSAGEDIGFLKEKRSIFGKPMSGPMTAQTVDECILIIPNRVFKQCEFDESNSSWHIYGADYCLTIADRGLMTYVIPCLILHNSQRSNSRYLWEFQEFLWLKHYRKHPNIHTTCGMRNFRYFLVLKIIKTIEKLFRNKIEISIYPFFLPLFNDCIYKAFKGFQRVLILENMPDDAVQYYPSPLTAEAEFFFGNTADSSVKFQYRYIYNMNIDEHVIKRENFDGAVVTLDLLQNCETVFDSLMDLFHKCAMKKIVLYSTPAGNEVKTSLFKKIQDEGFVAHTTLIWHYSSNTAKTLLMFSKSVN